jgi:hypothetical protein
LNAGIPGIESKRFEAMSESSDSSSFAQWASFLGDVRRESRVFKEALARTAAAKDESNAQFREWAHLSFGAIHNAKRNKPDPARAVPRLARPQTRSCSRASKRPSVFEFEDKDANYTRWPVRPATRTSQRVFAPVRLLDYPEQGRPHDIICVFGAPVSAGDDVLSVL